MGPREGWDRSGQQLAPRAPGLAGQRRRHGLQGVQPSGPAIGVWLPQLAQLSGSRPQVAG